MNYIGRIFTNFRDFYKEINSATLTGAIDVIVVEQPDGTFLSSPFHVRFGKMGVLRAREKIVRPSLLLPSSLVVPLLTSRDPASIRCACVCRHMFFLFPLVT